MRLNHHSGPGRMTLFALLSSCFHPRRIQPHEQDTSVRWIRKIVLATACLVSLSRHPGTLFWNDGPCGKRCQRMFLFVDLVHEAISCPDLHLCDLQERTATIITQPSSPSMFGHEQEGTYLSWHERNHGCPNGTFKSTLVHS